MDRLFFFLSQIKYKSIYIFLDFIQYVSSISFREKKELRSSLKIWSY